MAFKAKQRAKGEEAVEVEAEVEAKLHGAWSMVFKAKIKGGGGKSRLRGR